MNDRPQSACNPLRDQRGVSLPIALVMLIMMTTLGVTALKINQTDSLITGSVQRDSVAFNAAETGFAMLSERADEIVATNPRCVRAGGTRADYYKPDPSDVAIPYDVGDGMRITSMEACYLGQGTAPPIGFRLDEGTAALGANIRRHFYEMETIAAHGAKTSTIVAGFLRNGPANP